VPILRAENAAFRQKYDTVVKPLPYKQKLAIMQEPLDLPVTRMMTVDQHTRYLDAVHRMLSQQGFRLTDPEALG
jgi:ABC-type Na+ transport system ATPase subunit NatA